MSSGLLLFAGGLSSPAATNTTDELRFLPGYAGDAYLKYYLGQKGELQKKRFLTEGNKVTGRPGDNRPHPARSGHPLSLCYLVTLLLSSVRITRASATTAPCPAA